MNSAHNNNGDGGGTTDWGEEVLPGVFMLKRSTSAAERLAGALPADPARTIADVYAEAEELEELIQKLQKSNAELRAFFAPAKAHVKTPRPPKRAANEDDDDDADDDDAASDSSEWEEEDEGDEEEEADDGADAAAPEGDSTTAFSMEGLMSALPAKSSIRATRPEAGSCRQRHGVHFSDNVDGCDSAAAPAHDAMPDDVTEAIAENEQIISEKIKELETLLASVQHHKCGCEKHAERLEQARLIQEGVLPA
jgi:hypothetical protein